MNGIPFSPLPEGFPKPLAGCLPASGAPTPRPSPNLRASAPRLPLSIYGFTGGHRSPGQRSTAHTAPTVLSVLACVPSLSRMFARRLPFPGTGEGDGGWGGLRQSRRLSAPFTEKGSGGVGLLLAIAWFVRPSTPVRRGGRRRGKRNTQILQITLSSNNKKNLPQGRLRT